MLRAATKIKSYSFYWLVWPEKFYHTRNFLHTKVFYSPTVILLHNLFWLGWYLHDWKWNNNEWDKNHIWSFLPPHLTFFIGTLPFIVHVNFFYLDQQKRILPSLYPYLLLFWHAYIHLLTKYCKCCCENRCGIKTKRAKL